MGEDYIDQLLSSGQGTAMDDIVKITANEPRFWNPTEYGTTIKDGMVLQPQYESTGTGTEGASGPVTGVLRYKEGETAPGKEYEILDPVTGSVTGKGKFQKVGNLGSMLKETAIDLGPLLLTALGMPGAGSLGTMLGTSIAGGLGVTGLSAAQLAALGSAAGAAGLGLAQGQDPLDVLKSAALAGASAFVPSQVSSFLPSTGTPALDAALKKATELGTAAALKGGDVEGAVLGSLAGSGFGAATGATGIDPKLFNTVIDVARSGGDPQKLFNAVVGYDQSFGKGQPSGQAASAGYGGADQGFFDPDAETSPLPDWALDPYKNEEVDWAALYAQPTTNPVTGETIVGADQSGYPVQDFGALPQSDINDVYNRIINDRGGFASTWQTVGSDRVMVQDDGSAIGLNTETGETYGLDPAQTQRMIDAGLLNTAASGYDAAIRGTSPPTSGSKPSTPGKAPTPSPAPKAAKPGMDIGTLFAILDRMGGQQPTQAPAPYQTARINTESPFGLMYGLES